MPKNVVFDMDGVLLDTERLYTKCWEEVADENGIDGIQECARACVGLNHQDMEKVMKKMYGEDFDFEHFHLEIYKKVRVKMETEGVPIMKGVRELLSYLIENKYRIAVASSTGKTEVMDNLGRAGILDCFSVIICGDMIMHGKPEPDIYLRACKELGVVPAETYAIEDSYNGIRSACAAGMRPIMVPDMLEPTEEIEKMLYHKCESLLEVRDFLHSEEMKSGE